MSVWRVIYRVAMVVVVVLIVIATFFLLTPPAQTMCQHYRTKVQLMEETDRLKADIQDLAEKQRRFRSDPAFVERTAREAGMVKSNEVIYKLEEANADTGRR